MYRPGGLDARIATSDRLAGLHHVLADVIFEDLAHEAVDAAARTL
jgi:hypothetical protein